MKPTVPETGIIIRLEGDKAVIRLKGGKSYKGCGMGKVGLCRSGDTSMLLTASLFSFRKLRELDANHFMVANKIIRDNIFEGEVKSEEERWYPKYIGQ